jgi:N-formylglutamate amidohydrolase
MSLTEPTSHPIPAAASFELRRPKQQTLAAVFASPHSGTDYPRAFLATSRLDLTSLRRSEDCWVDELFAEAPSLGAPLLAALFPRSFVDPNREDRELDPQMFEDALPAGANTTSPRVAAGLGVIPRVVATGEEIYGCKLRFAEAAERLERYWHPYHGTLARTIDETRRQFGFCMLIDCHSMPSAGGPLERDMGWDRVDFVLGDCRGSACAPALTSHVEAGLRRMGYSVARNNPYSGGFVTQHYGRPAEGVHALQIEVNRGLYLDEANLQRGPGFARLVEDIGKLIRSLAFLSLGLAAAAE